MYIGNRKNNPWWVWVLMILGFGLVAFLVSGFFSGSGTSMAPQPTEEAETQEPEYNCDCQDFWYWHDPISGIRRQANHMAGTGNPPEIYTWEQLQQHSNLIIGAGWMPDDMWFYINQWKEVISPFELATWDWTGVCIALFSESGYPLGVYCDYTTGLTCGAVAFPMLNR